MIWDIDSHYSKSYYLSYNIFIKVQTQNLIAKKSKSEESWPKNSKLVKKKPLFYSTPICQ